MSAPLQSPGAARFCLVLLRRQLTLAVRRPIEIGNPLLFFAMVVALFPLGLGPAQDQLAGSPRASSGSSPCCPTC